MNAAYENLMTRRSIRKYKPDMVERELIDQVVQAGLYAPSGHAEQSSAVIVVTNKELRDEIAEENRKELRDEIAEENRKIEGWKEGLDPFYGAPVVLIVIANRASPNYIYDGSVTMENMALAAHALGLGSCWVHRARQEFESEFGKSILKRLGIEGDYEGIGHLILGYPAVDLPKPAKRKENRVFYIE